MIGMKKSQYDSYMLDCVTLLRSTDDIYTEYYVGYLKGLYRRFLDVFEPEAQYDIWRNIQHADLPDDDPDVASGLRDQGYDDGFSEKPPKTWTDEEKNANSPLGCD